MAKHILVMSLLAITPCNTSKPPGSRVTPVAAAQLPGLNALAFRLARIDYAPWGVVPPHVHPRATEILTIIEGSLEVGFVTSNPDNRLSSRSQNPGVIAIANAVLGSSSAIADELSRPFRLTSLLLVNLKQYCRLCILN
ncbi:hypothetical protein WN944_009356 [Citrus x changshan-huyou]|uniref:Cupin type-1 domain-containing protein n=1 Tax=Citrus x changshan-huyou TaxID=2935761 RepID=A0AAP0QW54_9ROSI